MAIGKIFTILTSTVIAGKPRKFPAMENLTNAAEMNRITCQISMTIAFTLTS
jgi:hypothetical protein